MIEMQQVHGNAMEPGTWVLAKYEDTPDRVVYMCSCGKVNAIDKRRLDSTGQVLDAEGNPETVACEKKGCDHRHELRFLEQTEDAMNAHRTAKLLREASELAIARGVTAESIAAVHARDGGGTFTEAPTPAT